MNATNSPDDDDLRRVIDTLFSLIDEDASFDRFERIGPTVIRIQFPNGDKAAITVVSLEVLDQNLYMRKGRITDRIRRRAAELVAELDVSPVVETDGGFDAGVRKMVITLGVQAAQVARRLAAEMGVSYPEVIRWGLMLVEFARSLGPDEELVIRNKKDGTLERLSFQWGSGQ